MQVANTLAYFDTAIITAIKSFIVQAPVGNCDIHVKKKISFMNEMKRYKNMAETERLSSKNLSNFTANVSLQKLA